MKEFHNQRPVLVIDDCQIYRVASKTMLLKLGLNPEQILLAKDASTALDFCQTESFQLVLCDYNLGSHTNGHQLLDEMIYRKLLPADCAIVIVTGNASTEVVRGFADLKPDGFLVKPVNFLTLQQRLPKIIRRKRMISQVLTTYAGGDFNHAIKLAEDAVDSATEMTNSALLLKARALIALNKLDDARNVLISINDAPESSLIQLELAQIAFKQKQFKLCETVLKPLEKDPITCTAALQLSAEVLFKQALFELALKKIVESVAKSPKHIVRHLMKAHIAMAQFDLKTAYQGAAGALKEASNSFRETLALHHFAAQLTLDRSQFADTKDKQKYLNRFTLQCQSWRNRFDFKEYKRFELLLMARASGLGGAITKAIAYFDEYQQYIKKAKSQPASVNEQIELAKVYLMFNNIDAYQATMQVLAREFNRDSTTIEHQAFRRYLARWCEQVERISAQISNLKTASKNLLHNKSYGMALEKLIKAQELNALDEEVASMLIFCLTKAWPAGWSKQEVSRLALKCRLVSTSKFNTAAYRRNCQILVAQLDIKELIQWPSASDNLLGTR
ncbi:Response regulator receiver domain-containing protein [Colwellia chukchiensis]|uniref:Response regulator receiver domain-containing protein n=1 Tax=Colwellia chukchiensis TaxID=641665 RepID=A0A1H7TVJ0_9GAMM|nr:response regulator [Colwellia chukchiensis]SEL88673.1 Response regulator receiver domain-containing protein [Colwellia chukchiensis]